MRKPGEAPDKVVAKDMGVSIATVRRMRIKSGIEAYRSQQIDWTNIDKDIFTKSCRDLASEHGVSPATISNRRKKLRSKK